MIGILPDFIKVWCHFIVEFMVDSKNLSIITTGKVILVCLEACVKA